MTDVLGKYRSGARSAQPEDVARAATVEALTEIIVEQRGGASAGAPPSATEYFASLVTALQGPRSPQRDTLVFLLSVCLVAVPRAVLRLKGEECVQLLLAVLRQEDELGSGDKDGGEQSQRVTRHCLTAVGVTLAAQETSKATWDRPKLAQAFHLLLNSCADERPKVRKLAQQAALLVLEEHRACLAPFRAVCQVATRACAGATVADCSQLMMLVSFLEQAMPVLCAGAPSKELAPLLQALANTVRLAHATLFGNALRALEAYFASFPAASGEGAQSQGEGEGEGETYGEAGSGPRRAVGAGARGPSRCKEVYAVVETLAGLASVGQPEQHKFLLSDARLCGLWASALQRGENALLVFSVEHNDARSCLPQVTEAFLGVLASGVRLAAEKGLPATGSAQVALAAGTLANVIAGHGQLCELRPELTLAAMDAAEQLLSPQFEEAWPVALEVLRAFFRARGGRVGSPFAGGDEAGANAEEKGSAAAAIAARETAWLHKLAAIREKVINPVTGADKEKIIVRWKGALERVVGAAVAALGPERVLNLRGDGAELGNERIGRAHVALDEFDAAPDMLSGRLDQDFAAALAQRQSDEALAVIDEFLSGVGGSLHGIAHLDEAGLDFPHDLIQLGGRRPDLSEMGWQIPAQARRERQVARTASG